MAARSTMANLITKVRSLINDPSGGSEVWGDQDIQDQLDRTRFDVRYEQLTPAPTILNAASTSNQAGVIWADYYSRYQWWEDDVVLQGVNTATSAAWIVLTPAASENFYGHWQFETAVFTSGTVPSQYPPVFATGKSFDVYMAAANLLEMWAPKYALSYAFTADGQSFQRQQIIDNLTKLACTYRMQARVVTSFPLRTDLQASTGGHVEHVPLLGNNDTINQE
jgi:hypothetical protein